MQAKEIETQAETDHGRKKKVEIGRIVSVSGAQAIVMLNNEKISQSGDQLIRPDMGTILRVDAATTTVFGMVSGLTIPVPDNTSSQEVWIAEVELVGELVDSPEHGHDIFSRGVSLYPGLGDPVFIASHEDLELLYDAHTESSIGVGRITQDPKIVATVKVNDLLGKHFAILGTTGTGKSCTVALLFQEILKQSPKAHIILLDPHDEYASAFKQKAEIIRNTDLHLPYWFFTFEEIIEVLVGSKPGRETVVEIMAELIPIAKARYDSAREGRTQTKQGGLRKSEVISIAHSVDSPVPYRMSDLLNLLDERMGRLDHKRDVWAHRDLKMRIEAIMQDPRYQFMFGSKTVQDNMQDILGRIFRIPVKDKPISILNLTGIPSEVVNVVVSVLCRMTFDFGLWSNGAVPITLVCEEAHRYIPADPSLGFEPTRRSIARVAKEGRKYGVSLCIVSQRPSELDSTILSQCNTVFAMRMANEKDQKIVLAAVSDAGAGMLDVLPSLGNREVIAFGDGMPFPARIKLNRIDENNMPRGRTALFTERWREESGGAEILEDVVERWRNAGGIPQDEGSLDQRLVDLGPGYRGRSPSSPHSEQ